MRIKYILLILLSLLGAYTYAYEYLEIATIPNTAVLNFWGQQNGKNYETHIDNSDFLLITGNDNKLYPCYLINGNGYTDTLWEVFFGYNDHFAYVCWDYTLRGIAKLWAWWRFSLDDTDITDSVSWITKVNKKDDPLDKGWYYHSQYGNTVGTGQVFSAWNGFFDWNSAKTNFNPYIYTAKQINKATFDIQRNKRADGKDKARFVLKLIADNDKTVPNFKIKYLKFLTTDSDFIIQDGANKISTLMFADDYSNKITNNNGELMWDVTSIMPIDGNFTVEVWFFSGDDTIKKTIKGSTKFTYPFSYNVVMSDGNGDGKVLIWDMEKVKLVLDKYGNDISVENLDWVWNLSGFVDKNRVVTSSWWFSHNSIDSSILWWVDIKITNLDSSIWEKVQLYYDISWKYNITIWGKKYSGIPFSTTTGYGDIYLDKIINTIKTWHDATLLPDGNKINNFWIQFINDDGYDIHWLNSNISVDDHQRKYISINSPNEKYKTFDTNEFTTDFDKGYYIDSYSQKTDIYWKLNFGVVSFKPVKKWKFDINLTNIWQWTSDWVQSARTVTTNEFSFMNVVNLNFAWDIINKWIAVNRQNELDIEFNKLSNHIDDTNCGYLLSGTIKWCPDCIFSGAIWNNFISTGFGTKSHQKIFIKWSIEPTAVDYYDRNYYYRVNGNLQSGAKIIDLNLKPNIETSNLRVIWKLIEPVIIWLVSRSWHNTNNITVINTKLPISAFISRYVKKIQEITRGKKENFVSDMTIDLSNITDNTKIYKCSDNSIISLSGIYDHNISLYFKNCRLNIIWDIMKATDDNKLIINLINDGDTKKVDFAYANWWDVSSNIFIKNNVSTIEARIFTEGSLFSYKDSINTENIFTANRRLDSDFSRQLYIKWKLISKNTVWWWVTNDFNEVQVIGGARFNKNSTNIFNIKALDVAQGYDVFFWRSSYISLNTNNYDLTKVSSVVKNKYACSGDALNDNKICLTPIVIEYER